MNDLKKRLMSRPVQACAACRIDCGGTLDIKTFYYPLRHLSPCTFNIALQLKTRVTLRPFDSGRIKVSSTGFDTEVYPADRAPFDTPLGLMFAVAACFQVSGVHVDIASESPPRSALGGSSAATVALIGALSMALEGRVGQGSTVVMAHAVEEAVAGLPCGMQDQLAATYGGVHAWYWPGDPGDPPFRSRKVVSDQDHESLERRLLLAYCGVPHESRDTNRKWIEGYVSGRQRQYWEEIVKTTRTFVRALSVKDWTSAVHAMNKEVDLRRELTPEVFDELGEALVDAARKAGCAARFAGAGGGGCIWALGDMERIAELKKAWSTILEQRPEAGLLDLKIDRKGLEVSSY